MGDQGAHALLPARRGMRTMKSMLIRAAALAVALTTPALAQTQSQLSDTDRLFVENAASSNLFEIRSSQMLLEEMGDDQGMPSLRQFAQMMITDHEAVNAQLQSIASSRGMQVPQEPAGAQGRMLDELDGFSGTQLASNYLQYQTVAHQDAINLFQRHTQQGGDPELQQFAQQTLPSLQHHLQMLLDLKAGEGIAETDRTQMPSTTSQ